MDELPRAMIEARLRLDEQLDELLRDGDYETVLRMVEVVRGDLALFARHARRAAATGDPNLENVTFLSDYAQRRRHASGWACFVAMDMSYS